MSDHTSLAAALAAFQADLPTIGKGETAKVQTKDGGSYSYSYADLADVSAIVLPLLAKQGLSFAARPAYDGDRFVLAYQLLHTSGETLDGAYPLPNATPQQVGSAITYARRYCLCAVTGVAPDDDDDGQAAQHAPPAASQAPEQSDLTAVTDAIADAKNLGIEGDYDATLEWAAQSPANAAAALSKLTKAIDAKRGEAA